MSEADASLYEYPFEYVRKHVKPERNQVRNPREKQLWWLANLKEANLREATLKGANLDWTHLEGAT